MGKKAAPKVPISRQIWQWTESVCPEDIKEEHVHTAYRLKLGKCKTCRKNCAANPNCLKGLGETYWLRERNPQSDVGEDDLVEGQRKEGEFVGLQNLGATCYVNTFLQLWFHNVNFRKAVYQFAESDKDVAQKDESKSTHSVCGHLQLIFGMLQCSTRKNIDPTPLITSLGLDTGLQQDAQEFSKLFLNLLESVSTVGDFLCKEFCGEYDYHTTCHTCGHISKRPSKFYELDLSIQGHKNVIQCLTEFFKEEQLNCENQYHCDSCQCKRDASRRIVVRSLPRTLNLQLLRFVFDKTTWNKKKLSTVISFPNTLDMSTFVSLENVPAEDMIYELTAVLIHRGPSASSGHYIAHIKDSSSQLWYKFNDESIVQMKSGKTLDLDAPTEDDFESDLLPKPAKKPRLKKDHHSSKNAYMLVYTKKKELAPSENLSAVPDLPEHVRKAVDEDNADFQSCLNAIRLETKQKADEDKKKHEQMSMLVKSMLNTEEEATSENSCWVPTTWLKQVLDPSNTEKSNFTLDKFLCPHKKLDPDRVGSLKYIGGFVVDHFLAMCKEESPRITNEMLCHQCVKERCFSLRLKADLKEDHALVTKLLKETSGQGEEYYVGRSTLRYWKTMALRTVEDNNKKSTDGTEATGADGSETNGVKESEIDKGSDSEEEDLSFNEDLLCEHANLTTDFKEYRAVSAPVWEILLKYFPNAPACKVSDCRSCSICLDKEHDEAQASELKKMMVSEQKSKLNNLFQNKNRPSYRDIHDAKTYTHEKGPSFYAVPANFVYQWRESLKNPSKNDLISELSNQIFLCPHKKLICDPVLSASNSVVDYQSSLDIDNTDPSTVLLWPHEWDYISKNFGTDIPIVISRQLHQNIDKSENGLDSVQNEIHCDSSSANGSEGDKEVEVQRESKTEESPDSLIPNSNDQTNQNPSNSGEFKVNITSATNQEIHRENKINFVYNPPVCLECMEGMALERERNLRNYTSAEIYVRKVIPENGTGSIPKILDTKEALPVSQTSSVRRSRRTHTTRGEKKLTVSSDWTLKQLKIKIMSLFSIPPFDQNIWLSKKKLTEDEATLGTLSIIPGSTLIVIADEPDEKSLDMLPVIPPKKDNLEEGFKGTTLLGLG